MKPLHVTVSLEGRKVFQTVIAGGDCFSSSLRAHSGSSGSGSGSPRLALITNSHVDYSELLMRFAFGPDWRRLFDLVVFNAGKGHGFVHPLAAGHHAELAPANRRSTVKRECGVNTMCEEEA